MVFANKSGCKTFILEIFLLEASFIHFIFTEQPGMLMCIFKSLIPTCEVQSFVYTRIVRHLKIERDLKRKKQISA